MRTDLKAGDIMTKSVLMAYEGWSIKRLSQFLIKNKVSGVPVIASDHSLVGVVTLSDVVKFESKSHSEKCELLSEVYSEFVGQQYDTDLQAQMMSKAGENCTVNQVMTKHVVQVDVDTSFQEVAYVMLQNGIRRVFVTKNSVMCGVISGSNILTAVAK
ncbi:MAG: putative transcriptional regulator [Bermanella sp.]|jgi:predicted transcriptional regulator